MYTRVKTADEIVAMRESGRMLASVLSTLESKVSPGMTGRDVSELAKSELRALGGKPAFLGFMGYPDVICISVNDAVVHGLPDEVPFKDGDLVSLDFGVNYKGMITDSALTVNLGNKDEKVKKLVQSTERAMYAGIETLKDGVRVGEIANAIEGELKKASVGIVRELVGHGVGHSLHEDPNIPNYGPKTQGPVLKAGMTIAIEPMATLGTESIYIDSDNWTIRTKDGSPAAHFEHTILITADGYEVLTER